MEEIKRDSLEVIPRTAFEPVGGARPEPEETLAIRTLTTESPTEMSLDHARVGGLETRIVYEDTAQTFAMAGSKNCALCLHWNQERWHHTYRKWKADREKNKFLNRARAFLPDDDEGTSEQAMVADLAICDALTEISGGGDAAPSITHRAASCPSQTPAGDKLVLLFVPKDLTRARQGSLVYDKVMLRAKGKR